jgi:predicted hydrocarbon binding protein
MPPAVPVLLPLAVLEAVQNIDTPADDGLGALEQELAAKRLGLSPTVAAQAGRYRARWRGGGTVPDDEAVAVFRLVGRRPDAELVFADAGRRAARMGASELGAVRRGITALLPGRFGVLMALRGATRAARQALLLDLEADRSTVRCQADETLAWRARGDGTGCQFYTSALAELLRQAGRLEWPVTHESCRARGDRHCVWRAASPETSIE